MPDNSCLQLPPSPPSTLPLTSRALPEAGGEPSGSRSPEGYADEIVVDTDPRDPYVSRAESCGPSDDDDLDDLLTPLSPTWPVRFRHNVPSPEGLEESALLSRSPSFMPMADASLDEPMNEEEGAPGGQGGSRAFFDAAGLPPLRHDTLWVDDSDASMDCADVAAFSPRLKSFGLPGDDDNLDMSNTHDHLDFSRFPDHLGRSTGSLTHVFSDDSSQHHMDFDDTDMPPASPRQLTSHFPGLGFSAQTGSEDLDLELAPYSPSRRNFTLLPAMDEDEDEFPDTPQPSSPSSPSRRSFASLPDIDMDDAISPSHPTPSPRLLSLPGADTDDDLLLPAFSYIPNSEPPPPDGPSLGLFVPIAFAEEPHIADSPPEEEPDLNFSWDARARVDAAELDKLVALRRRAWFLERNAKRTEQSYAEEAQRIAAGLRVSPPVPGALADVQLQAGLDPKGAIRRELQVAEARRAEARRVRKKEKERGKEVQAMLRLKLDDGVGAGTPEAPADAAVQRDERGKVVIGSFSQLVARMIFKRRDASRVLANKKTPGDYVCSSLSRAVSPDFEDVDSQ